jgi:hypothetical protein
VSWRRSSYLSEPYPPFRFILIGLPRSAELVVAFCNRRARRSDARCQKDDERGGQQRRGCLPHNLGSPAQKSHGGPIGFCYASKTLFVLEASLTQESHQSSQYLQDHPSISARDQTTAAAWYYFLGPALQRDQMDEAVMPEPSSPQRRTATSARPAHNFCNFMPTPARHKVVEPRDTDEPTREADQDRHHRRYVTFQMARLMWGQLRFEFLCVALAMRRNRTHRSDI